MLRILLVEEDEAVRAGLRAWLALDPDLTVVGEAADGVQALVQVRVHRPQVVVMNIDVPLLNGPATAEVLRATWPRCVVVLFRVAGTSFPAGVVNLSHAPADIFNAIHAAGGRTARLREAAPEVGRLNRWSPVPRSIWPARR